MAESDPRLFAVLRHRDFRLVWFGNLISGCGVWAQNLALGWLLLKLSGSALLLGAYGCATLLPILGLSLVGGTIADRTDRRTVLLAAQTILLVLSLALGVLTLAGLVGVWQILVIALLSGSAVAFNSPAYQAMIPDLVPPADLTRAIALNSIQFNVARIVGHATAGVIVTGVGEAGCFFLNAASYTVMLYALWRVRSPSRHRIADQVPFRRRMREGINYVRNDRALRLLILTVGCVSLLGLPYFFLLPLFGRDVLGAGARGLGLLTASVSVGALVGGLTVHRLASRWGKTPTLLTGIVLFWTALLTFSASRNFALSIGAVAAVGLGLVLTVVTVNNLLQVITPPELRGRVMGVHAMALNGLAPIGSLIAGAAAAKTSAPVTVFTMALLGLGCTVAAVMPLRRLQQ